METVKKIVGLRLRNLREVKNLTQEQLAERVGLSGKFIGEIERGTGNPTIESLAKIAQGLNTPLAQLLVKKEEEELFSELSKQDLQTIKRALEILGRVFGKK